LQGIGIEDRVGRVPPIAWRDKRPAFLSSDGICVTIKEERIEAADDVSEVFGASSYRPESVASPDVFEMKARLEHIFGVGWVSLLSLAIDASSRPSKLRTTYEMP
jgi:hypothetical protein